jgi:putative flavoprotein involved in K+ transport
MNAYDVLVIGAGQAGLAMGYYLRQARLRFLIVDQCERVGDRWRQRYDTLVLFTPRSLSDLPGLPFPGDRDGLPGKNDVADYLERYAAHFSLPIRTKTPVSSVEKYGNGFLVTSGQEQWFARQVVIATGPFQSPWIPEIHRDAAPDVVQLHTDAYKNEHQLRPGPVLVVGDGNSGVQIAVELAASRPVVLSIGRQRSFLPQRLLGKPIFWYFKLSGLLSIPVTTLPGQWLSRQPDPIIGCKRQFQYLKQQGRLRVTGRTIRLSGNTATFSDGSQAEAVNIIWATGFRCTYDWLHVPGVLDANGRPIHRRGVTPTAGLYFLGLPWQYRRSSALLGGVGEDARYLLKHILHTSGRHPVT